MEHTCIPVGLDALKRHLRIYSSEMDESLMLLLLAAVENVQNYTLIDFAKDYPDPGEVPYALRAAILLDAARMFQNPADGVDKMQTISKNLSSSYRRWDRIEPTRENS